MIKGFLESARRGGSEKSSFAMDLVEQKLTIPFGPKFRITDVRSCQSRPFPYPPPLCDMPSGCCFFTGPWTVTRSSLRMLRRVAAFCRPVWPVLLLVSFLRSRSPVVGVPGLCWLRRLPFVRQQCPVVGVPQLCWVLQGSLGGSCCPRTSVLRSSTPCLAAFLCA